MAIPDPVPQRKDARKNRARILDAADTVFQVDDIDVSLDAVILKAGVGRTTFFRHFADRPTLLAALLERSIDELAEEADRVQEDPNGLLIFLEFMASRMGMRANLVRYWNAADPHHPAVQNAFMRSQQIFTNLINQAQAQSLCRTKLTAEDLIMMGRMIGGALNGCDPAHRATTAKQALSLLLDGLRPRH